MTTCACGQLTWQGGVISMWSDGVQHFADDLICVATDDLLVDGGAW